MNTLTDVEDVRQWVGRLPAFPQLLTKEENAANEETLSTREPLFAFLEHPREGGKYFVRRLPPVTILKEVFFSYNCSSPFLFLLRIIS